MFLFYFFPKIARDRHCYGILTCLFALLEPFCSPDMEIMCESSNYLSFVVNMSSRVGNANPRCHFCLHLFYNTAVYNGTILSLHEKRHIVDLSEAIAYFMFELGPAHGLLEKQTKFW